jgi:hypothetical protein
MLFIPTTTFTLTSCSRKDIPLSAYLHREDILCNPNPALTLISSFYVRHGQTGRQKILVRYRNDIRRHGIPADVLR